MVSGLVLVVCCLLFGVWFSRRATDGPPTQGQKREYDKYHKPEKGV